MGHSSWSHLLQFLSQLHLLRKAIWNRLNLFIFQPNKFLCLPPFPRRWTKQSTPLAGKDLQPAKKRENTDEVKIEKTAIQLPLGSRHCPHLLQPPKKEHIVSFFRSAQKSI